MLMLRLQPSFLVRSFWFVVEKQYLKLTGTMKSNFLVVLKQLQMTKIGLHHHNQKFRAVKSKIDTYMGRIWKRYIGVIMGESRVNGAGQSTIVVFSGVLFGALA
ncbi:hypothetical protein ACET3Z_004514 [Daucus carota]